MSEKGYLIEPAECRNIGLYAARALLGAMSKGSPESAQPVIKLIDHADHDTVWRVRHEAGLDDVMRFECQVVRSEGYRVLIEWIEAEYRKPRRTDSLYLGSGELGFAAYHALIYASGRTGDAVNDVGAFLVRHAAHFIPEDAEFLCEKIRRSLTPEGIEHFCALSGLKADDDRVISALSQWRKALGALESAIEERDTAKSVNRAWERTE